MDPLPTLVPVPDFHPGSHPVSGFFFPETRNMKTGWSNVENRTGYILPVFNPTWHYICTLNIMFGSTIRPWKYGFMYAIL
jgi:hypothetical protein